MSGGAKCVYGILWAPGLPRSTSTMHSMIDRGRCDVSLSLPYTTYIYISSCWLSAARLAVGTAPSIDMTAVFFGETGAVWKWCCGCKAACNACCWAVHVRGNIPSCL
jgi:hypothetical protein